MHFSNAMAILQYFTRHLTHLFCNKWEVKGLQLVHITTKAKKMLWIKLLLLDPLKGGNNSNPSKNSLQLANLSQKPTRLFVLLIVFIYARCTVGTYGPVFAIEQVRKVPC